MENWQILQSKLIAAARTDSPSDRVPYAFEKRITALIQARSPMEPLAAWVRGLWRAAVSSAVLALLLGVWTVFNPAASTKADDLSQNFETTLLASVDQSDSVQ